MPLRKEPRGHRRTGQSASVQCPSMNGELFSGLQDLMQAHSAQRAIVVSTENITMNLCGLL